MKKLVQVVAAAAALSLSACGGGGGDDQSAGNAPTAQGLYVGATNTGRTVTGLILSDGTTYVLYSVAGNSHLIAGVIQGTVGTSSNEFRGQDGRDFNLEGLGVLNATVAGTYVSKKSISGAVFYAEGSVAFSGAYSSDYEIKASLASVAGAYTGQVASSAGVQNATFTVSSAGIVSGSASGCAATGMLMPRTDGNAYDTTMTFGAAPCVFAGQTLRGISYYNAATRTLYSAAPNADRTNGVLLVGSKP